MAETLPPDVKENVINNFQDKFPSIVDRRIIYRVLDNENWNFEKAFHIFQRLHNEFSKSAPKDNSKKLPQGNNNGQLPKVKKNRNRSKNKKASNDESGKIGNAVPKINPFITHDSGSSQANPPVFLDPKQAPLKCVKQQQQHDQAAKLQKNKITKTELKKSYDIIKQLKDPFDRIVAYTRARIKVMVFMRGCSGSGKSTYAHELLNRIGITDHKWYIFSADDYFIDTNGTYKYSADLIVGAHEWSHALVKQAAGEGRSPIIVDNTHTRLWEMKDNAATAVEYGYVIETLEPKTPWFFVEAQLFRKSSHRVSRDTIQRMLDRYEANITGTDIVTKLRLNYKQSPPIKQVNDFNSPPSKKSIKLYNNKNNNIDIASSVVNSDINSADNFNRKFNINRINPQQFQQQSRFKPVNAMQTINDPNVSNRFNHSTIPNIPTPRWVEEQNLRTNVENKATFNTPQASFTTSALSTIPSIYCGPSLTLQKPDSFLGGASALQHHQQQNSSHLINEPNANNIIHTDVVNLASSFDLINLEEEQDSCNKTNYSRDDRYVSNYYTDLKQLSFNNVDTSDSDTDEEENDEDDDNSSVNSENRTSSNASFDEIDFNEKPTVYQSIVKNCCKEYVLIQPDKTVVFQKQHNNLPNTLNDFITNYIDDNVMLKQNENEATEEKSMKNDNFEGIDEKKTDKTEGKVQKICDNFDNFITQYLLQSGIGLNERANAENVDVGDEAAAVFMPTPNSALSKDAAEKTDASSNTNHTDFDILKRVNNFDEAGNFGNNILIGKPWFESAPFVNNMKSVNSILMLDKSSMTQDVETNHVNNSNVAVDSLEQMFPTIKRENLEELLNKCRNDLDWAVGILLDSGHEMCEFTATPELCQQSSSSTLDNDDSTKSEENDLNLASTSNGNGKVPKRKRKIQVHLSEDSLNLLQNFQDKFQLSDEHYSENITKLRKHRTLNTLESAPNMETLTPLQEELQQTTDDGPEDGVVEEEDEEVEAEEEEERENDAALVLDKYLVVQLQNKFGGLLSSNLIPDKTVIHIPQSLARQFYSYTFDAIYEHLEEQQAVIDMLISEAIPQDNGEDIAPSTSQPSFQEIMDHEMALRMSQTDKDESRSNTMASALSRTLLLERFPNFDPSTLATILEDTNHSLHEATNLLSFAGHPVKSPEDSQDEQSPLKKSESGPLSRKEAVQQAQAYSDVAGKLYDMREDCLRKAEKAIAAGNKTVAVYYSEMAKWYMERIEQSNSLAASAMLNGYESATTLDLHFLQVPQALKVLDLFLDEKIRSLKTRKSTVYIITGRGSHSPQGLCKIKAAVQVRLNKRHIAFSEQNPGMLKAKITKRTLISYKKMEN